MNKEEHSVYAIKFYTMQDQIDNLQKKADHYKHLYSEVKKQKDDVVEYIKNYLQFRKEFDLDKLLRMLGETDD